MTVGTLVGIVSLLFALVASDCQDIACAIAGPAPVGRTVSRLVSNDSTFVASSLELPPWFLVSVCSHNRLRCLLTIFL